MAKSACATSTGGCDYPSRPSRVTWRICGRPGSSKLDARESGCHYRLAVLRSPVLNEVLHAALHALTHAEVTASDAVRLRKELAAS